MDTLYLKFIAGMFLFLWVCLFFAVYMDTKKDYYIKWHSVLDMLFTSLWLSVTLFFSSGLLLLLVHFVFFA
jgi:hypothetical protein